MTLRERMLEHLGHPVEIAVYAGQYVALECMTCTEVIWDDVEENGEGGA
jgi:hypothetical protein